MSLSLAEPPSPGVRCTYIRFNFKAAIISDEKQEQLVSVLIDAHTGCAAAEPSQIEAVAINTQPDQLLDTLADAPMRWRAKDQSSSNPLDQATLTALLGRAETAVLNQLAPSTNSLQKRLQRFRILDEARLNEYYDEIERDLKRRLTTASFDRRASLEDKLETVSAERSSKLTDVAERYQMRVNLTLLNLAIIQQPKLIMPVGIENRTSKTTRYAVWDPLLHRLEPLLDSVSGQPSQRTYLCYNGHLTHQTNLAPACIDCKRIFCQKCAHEIGECDVCHQSLCRHSRIDCTVCGARHLPGTQGALPCE